MTRKSSGPRHKTDASKRNGWNPDKCLRCHLSSATDCEKCKPPMNLEQAQPIAEHYRNLLLPHCCRCEIAGSVRRKNPEVGDIEIVLIPKPYDVGLFTSGIAAVLDKLTIVRGQLPCKYTQRMLPEGIALDVFIVRSETWGLQFAIRTGSARYSHDVLACGWVRNGYKSVDGMLTRNGVTRECREERDLFRMAGVEWIVPELRV